MDHAERRADLLEATWRVVRARGVEGTTTRAIAQEAGCSLSVLAHFLGSKDDILVAAQTAVYERIVERAFALGKGRYGLAGLRAAFEAVLPLDEVRTADAHVNLAFAAAALSHPHLAQARRSSHERIRALLGATLREARERGELRDGVVDEDVVDDVVVTVEGATLLTLVDGRYDDDRVRRLERIADEFVAGLRAP